MSTKLLVVVDESPATKRELEYVAQLASRRAFDSRLIKP